MKKFKGKNAWWFMLLFVLYNVLPLCFLYGSKEMRTGWWIVLWIVYYLWNLLWIPIIVNNKIELYDSYFVFSYGFSKQTILIKDIKKIERSHCVIASSANSFDRIYIETKNDELYVSLQENECFIEEVKNRFEILQADNG